MTNPFKTGDKVRVVNADPSFTGIHNGETYEVRSTSFNSISIKTSKLGVLTYNSKYFELVEDEQKEIWSDWSCNKVGPVKHPKWFKGCEYKSKPHCVNPNLRWYSIRLDNKPPQHIKVSELKGTVQMNEDGTPNWKTYTEKE